MGRLIGLLLLVVSMNAFAEEGFVNQWWDQEYNQRIRQEQQIEYKKKEASRCNSKVKKYQRNLLRKPTSSYYRWKLESWKERCKEDSSANPYINN